MLTKARTMTKLSVLYQNATKFLIVAVASTETAISHIDNLQTDTVTRKIPRHTHPPNTNNWTTPSIAPPSCRWLERPPLLQRRVKSCRPWSAQTSPWLLKTASTNAAEQQPKGHFTLIDQTKSAGLLLISPHAVAFQTWWSVTQNGREIQNDRNFESNWFQYLRRTRKTTKRRTQDYTCMRMK